MGLYLRGRIWWYSLGRKIKCSTGSADRAAAARILEDARAVYLIYAAARLRGIDVPTNQQRSLETARAIRGLSMVTWAHMLSHWRYACAYCERKFERGELITRDHVIPTARGGSLDAANVVPACCSCNIRKRIQDTKEWMCAAGYDFASFAARRAQFVAPAEPPKYPGVKQRRRKQKKHVA